VRGKQLEVSPLSWPRKWVGKEKEERGSWKETERVPSSRRRPSSWEWRVITEVEGRGMGIPRGGVGRASGKGVGGTWALGSGEEPSACGDSVRAEGEVDFPGGLGPSTSTRQLYGGGTCSRE
jgi:hypothetical protein